MQSGKNRKQTENKERIRKAVKQFVKKIKQLQLIQLYLNNGFSIGL